MDVLSLRDKINQRSGHIAVSYKELILIWGGYMELPSETRSTDYHCTDELLVYSALTGVWSRVSTKGNAPTHRSGSCGVVIEDYLYIFGGFCVYFQNDFGSANDLYRLNLHDLTWQLLDPSGTQPANCDKLTGWEFNGKMYLFGGFGPRKNINSKFEYVVNLSTLNEGMGWNNQLVAYDPANNCWDWPKTRGVTPSPRAAHAADISDGKVYLFGGRLQDNRMDDMYCLNMKTMKWSSNLTVPSEPHPEGRSWHSLKFVTPNKMVLYGGLSQSSEVLGGYWCLDIVTHTWVHHTDGKFGPRMWHQAAVTKEKNVVIIGGHQVFSFYAGPNVQASDFLTIDLAPKPLLKIALDFVLQHRENLQVLWKNLPAQLQEVLKLRCELLQIR